MCRDGIELGDDDSARRWWHAIGMRLKIPGGIDHAIDMLNSVDRELALARSGSPNRDLRNAYLLWWERADEYLGGIFKDTDLVDELYRSQLVVRQANESQRSMDLAEREMRVWKDKLQVIVSQLRGLKEFAGAAGRIVVPDTSALIEGAYFTDLDWHAAVAVGSGELVRLVIPILVVEELDDLKRDRNARVSRRARSVLHKLWDLQIGKPGMRAELPGRHVTAELFLDEPWHVRRPVNDDETTERAAYLHEITGKTVTLAAADYKMLFRAKAAGLTPALIERPATPSDNQDQAS